VLVARACERAVDLAVAEERGGVQRGMTFAVADPRIGAGGAGHAREPPVST
jgi:hypothetical protein